MKKTIILLSGTPSGKAKFDEIAKQKSWVWNLNPKNFLGVLAVNHFYCKDRDDNYYSFLSKMVALLNQSFDYEKTLLKEKIEDFQNDTDETKSLGGNTFDKFILIIHGVTQDTAEYLKGEYGVFQIRISSRPPDEEERQRDTGDFALYEDDPDFEAQIEKLIDIITK